VVNVRTGQKALMANKKTNLLFSLMAQKLCWVTITDIQGGGRVVEVKASSLFEAVAQAVKLKCGRIATDGFRPTDQGPCLRTKGRRRGKAEGFHGVARPKQPIAAGNDQPHEDKGATWHALNRANALTIDLNSKATRRV
jgi:hypothetical protein